MTGELFKARAGVDIVGVPYRSGGESVTAVLGQEVQMTFESITILLPLIREGKAARARGDEPQPHPARARPADHDRGRRAGLRGHDLQRHRRAGRHAGADRRAAQRRDQRRPRCSPEMQETIAKLGAVTDIGTPDEFGAFVARQFQKWESRSARPPT